MVCAECAVQTDMSFKTSDSIDALIENCKRESEAVQIPQEAAEQSAAEATAAEIAETPEAEHTTPIAPSALKTEPVRQTKKKKVPAYGKNGRAIKTDPYGNPIRKRKKDAPLRSEVPVDTVTPADIRKPQVSFMNSMATLEPAARSRWSGSTSQAYDHAVLREGGASEDEQRYRPKIRRMSHSTRAKELSGRKKRRSHSMPYQKDTLLEKENPAPNAVKRRKTKNDAVGHPQNARIPEALMEQPYEESAPIRYMEKAEHTHISFGEAASGSETEVDIDVRYDAERRPRMDLPKQEKTYQKREDKLTIQRDIAELQNTLTLRVMLLSMITLCSILVTLLDWIPGIPLPVFMSSAQSPMGYLTIQILLGLLAVPVSWELLKSGFKKLFRLRADCDTLAALSLCSAELSAVLTMAHPAMLQNRLVSVYISTALLSVWINAISRKLIVSRAQRNFEVLSDDTPKYAIHYVEDEKRAENLTRGTSGDFPIMATMQPAKHLNDFLRYTFSSDLADKYCRIAVPIVALLALLVSVFLSLLRSEALESALCYGVSIFALFFSAAACASITLVSNLPMDTGTKRYVRNGGLLLGYQSVDDFFDVNTVMVDVTTLFPEGSAKLHSIQVIGESRIEESLQYAASLTKHAGSILKDLFAGAIMAEQQLILSVENYAYEDGKGIGGWLDNKRVLLGTREMMLEHSIAGLPAYSKESELTAGGNEALYLSVSGTVSALFIIRLDSSRSIKRWLHELERERIYLLVRCNDALLSQRRIAKMFGFSEELLKMIPARLESDFEAETQSLNDANPSMVCAGRLPGFVQTIVGAKRIRRAAMLGVVLQAASACLGLLYVLIFLIIGAHEDLSGGILLVFHLISTLLTLSAVHLKEV